MCIPLRKFTIYFLLIGGTNNGFNSLDHLTNTITGHRDDFINKDSDNSSLNVVLPPPPEFQEPHISHGDFMSQQTYGDYEVLSPDAGYDYEPWKVDRGARQNKRSGHRYRTDSNDAGFYTRQSRSRPPSAVKMATKITNSARPTNYALNQAYSIVRHGSQYSTEL
jgi:hypothetical protein